MVERGRLNRELADPAVKSSQGWGFTIPRDGSYSP